jgi:hypothetical protein
MLNNWTYSDVTDFLKSHGFSFYQELGGSHQAWTKTGGRDPDRFVTVNFTHGSYPVRTLKTMIRQSGINQHEWINWAADG